MVVPPYLVLGTTHHFNTLLIAYQLINWTKWLFEIILSIVSKIALYYYFALHYYFTLHYYFKPHFVHVE